MRISKLKYNIKFFTSFIIINFLLIALIFYICFFMIAQLGSFLKLYHTLDNDYVYIYNDKTLDKKITAKMKINAAYYELRYIEIEDEYRMVLYTNNKGLELGIPYLDGNIKLAFFAFNKVEIKEKSLLTSNINYVNDDVEYISYFDSYESRNFFFDINYRLDYLYVDNDYFKTAGNHDLLVVTEDTSSLINANSNGFKEHSFIANGEMIKSNSLTAYKTEILLLILLSFIPLFFSTFALRNMYSYYISKNKEEIQINYIFYKSQKKNISSCFWELFIMTSIPSTLALLMVYLINGAPSFWAFIVALLIILLFEMITIRKNTVKEVMRHCANNGWREI